MAVRLSVMMIHTPPRSVNAERMGEGVVGRLIGLEGADLTLVGPLASLHESSTDRLSLEALSGDVAVLDWQSPEATHAALGELGFKGQRSPHAHDREFPDREAPDREAPDREAPDREASAPSPRERRIFLFDLSAFSEPDEVVDALTKLKQTRAVKTFSLGLGPKRSPKESVSRPERQNPPTSEAVAPVAKPVAPVAKPADPEPRHSLASPDRGLDLDDLIDQLDQLDP